MKAACCTDPANPSVALIKQVCYPREHKFTTSATKWGCDHEDAARKTYISEAEASHSNFMFNSSGLFIWKEFQFIAVTPDGVVQCDCCGSGIVEIKCPFCTKDDNPDTARFLTDGHLDVKHQYYYQVQTQLAVCSAEFADFITYTFPGGTSKVNVERITLNLDFVENCVDKATRFYEVAILPELLGRWYTRAMVLPTIDDSQSLDYDYCYCKEEKGGTMVLCSNPGCKDG